MNILAVETTSAVLSVAIGTEEKIIAEFTTNNKKNHSVSLIPAIRDMLEYVDFDIKNIDLIACSSGPGSFTGLRIGAAAAKGIAYSLNKKIIPVPTLDAMAYNAHLFCGTIVPMIDARNNEVFTSFYEYNNDTLNRRSEYMAENIDKIFEMLKEKDAMFLGDGAVVHKDKITENGFKIADSSIIMPKASSLLQMALQNIENAVETNKFELMYLRRSQAERELEKKQGITI